MRIREFLCVLALGIFASSLANAEDDPDVRHLKIGESITISCGDGSHNPNLRWTKFGDTLHLSKRISILQNGSLRIEDGTPDDVGYYDCWTSPYSAQKRVHLAYLAFTEPMPTEATVKESEDFSLECSAAGNPKPFTLHWLLNGSPIGPSDRRSFSANSHRVPNGILHMKSIETGDEGTYTCLVMKEHYFNITANTNITVISILQAAIQEIKADLSGFKVDIRTELSNLRSELKEELTDQRTEINNLKRIVLNEAERVSDGLFLIVKEEKTWMESRDNCRRMGGDLASPPSDFEAFKTFVSNENRGRVAWIGGREEEESGVFTYLDGTHVQTQHWYPTQPDHLQSNSCVLISAYADPPLIDDSCSYPRYSICRFD